MRTRTGLWMEELGDSGSRILRLAREEAVRLGHPYIGVEHLFLGLLRTKDPELAERLNGMGADSEVARLELEKSLPSGDAAAGMAKTDFPYTRRAKKVLNVLSSTGVGDPPAAVWWNAITEDRWNIVAQMLRELEESADRP